MEDLQKQINDLKVEQQLLNRDMVAFKAIAMALAIKLSETSSEDAARTMTLLEAVATRAQFAEEEPAGAPIMFFIDELKALLEYGDASHVLFVQAAQAQDVGRDKLPALREWHAQATDDELAQDVAALLKKVLRQQPPERPPHE